MPVFYNLNAAIIILEITIPPFTYHFLSYPQQHRHISIILLNTLDEEGRFPIRPHLEEDRQRRELHNEADVNHRITTSTALGEPLDEGAKKPIFFSDAARKNSFYGRYLHIF